MTQSFFRWRVLGSSGLKSRKDPCCKYDGSGKVISPQIELKEAAQNMEERHELVFAARVGAEVGRKAREATVSGGIIVN